jgi:hypothetical protein
VDLGKAWMEFVEEAGKESAAQRRRARLVLRLVIDVLSDALTVSQGGTARRTMKDDEAFVRKLADRIDADVLMELIDRCLEADQQIEWRVQLVLVLEALLDALAQKMAA